MDDVERQARDQCAEKGIDPDELDDNGKEQWRNYRYEPASVSGVPENGVFDGGNF